MFCPSEFAETLRQVVSDRPDRAQVVRLVTSLQRVALAYLRLRRRRSDLRLYTGGLDDQDIALECVADLFERDDRGCFIRLRQRFGDMVAGVCDDEAIWIHARRVVLRKVDDGLFRMAQDADPGLGRLIRNLRLAAHARRDVRLVRTLGHLWLCIDGATPHSGRLAMPDEMLQRQLLVRGAGTSAIQLLESTVIILREQQDYERVAPLIALAISLRSAVARTGDGMPGYAELDGHFALDARDFAARAADQVARSMGSRKLPSCSVTNDTYLAAAVEVLTSEMAGDGSAPHHEVLARHAGALSREEYRAVHRNRFEYIVKQTRAAIAGILRADERLAANRI